MLTTGGQGGSWVLRDQRVICWPQVSFLQPTGSPSKYSIQIFPASRKPVIPRFPPYPVTGKVMPIPDLGKYMSEPTLSLLAYMSSRQLCCHLIPFLEQALDSQPGQSQLLL